MTHVLKCFVKNSSLEIAYNVLKFRLLITFLIRQKIIHILTTDRVHTSKNFSKEFNICFWKRKWMSYIFIGSLIFRYLFFPILFKALILIILEAENKCRSFLLKVYNSFPKIISG